MSDSSSSDHALQRLLARLIAQKFTDCPTAKQFLARCFLPQSAIPRVPVNCQPTVSAHNDSVIIQFETLVGEIILEADIKLTESVSEVQKRVRPHLTKFKHKYPQGSIGVMYAGRKLRSTELIGDLKISEAATFIVWTATQWDVAASSPSLTFTDVNTVVTRPTTDGCFPVAMSTAMLMNDEDSFSVEIRKLPGVKNTFSAGIVSDGARNAHTKRSIGSCVGEIGFVVLNVFNSLRSTGGRKMICCEGKFVGPRIPLFRPGTILKITLQVGNLCMFVRFFINGKKIYGTILPPSFKRPLRACTTLPEQCCLALK